MGKLDLSYNEAKKLFRTEDSESALLWNCRRPGVRPGMPAGFFFKGTRYVTVDGRRVLARDIVWLLNTGTRPTCQLFHKNGNRADIRFSNLTPRKPKPVEGRTFLEVARNDDGELLLRLDGKMVARAYDPEQIAQTARALLVY